MNRSAGMIFSSRSHSEKAFWTCSVGGASAHLQTHAQSHAESCLVVVRDDGGGIVSVVGSPAVVAVQKRSTGPRLPESIPFRGGPVGAYSPSRPSSGKNRLSSGRTSSGSMGSSRPGRLPGGTASSPPKLPSLSPHSPRSLPTRATFPIPGLVTLHARRALAARSHQRLP